MTQISRILAAAGTAALLAAAPWAAAAQANAEAAGAYAARNEAAIWIRGEDESRARALIGVLRQAHVHALPVSAYEPDRLEAMLSRTDPAGRAEAERALSRAYVDYAIDVSSGVLDPGDAASNIYRSTPRPNAETLLAAAAAAPDMAAHLMTLPPQEAGYWALLRRYAELRESPDWGPQVNGDWVIELGDRGPEVQTVRRRLAALGDHDLSQVSDPAVFDSRLAADVRAFQRRHGLNEDGAVGPRTREALNATPAFRAQQIAVNLERSRWMNHDLGQRRIIVNQPGYTVTLIDGDEVLFHERVIVGEPQHETPEFSDEMEYLVFNPAWNVPRSIAVNELLPQLKDDPGLLARRNMVLIGSNGVVPASQVDFSRYSASTFPYRIRQNPNDDNALGDVKFMFPNDFAIYLHDTPTKHLFAKDRRAFSHGCVRVQNPMRLAEILLSDQRGDAGSYIDQLLASDRETHVSLDRRMPVHLVYRTAWVDAAGRDNFRADIYGRDEEVMASLRAAGVETFRRPDVMETASR